MTPDAATISVQPQDVGEQPALQRGLTVFLCANCARPARAATSAGRPRPVVPEFGWPWPVRQALVSCTGRLQPEHVLKAFESGSEAVCMIACQEDDCTISKAASGARGVRTSSVPYWTRSAWAASA